MLFEHAFLSEKSIQLQLWRLRHSKFLKLQEGGTIIDSCYLCFIALVSGKYSQKKESRPKCPCGSSEEETGAERLIWSSKKRNPKEEWQAGIWTRQINSQELGWRELGRGEETQMGKWSGVPKRFRLFQPQDHCCGPISKPVLSGWRKGMASSLRKWENKINSHK